ncbi:MULTISPECIES: TraY domain-containing protein [Pseudomonas aeruginosa group]|uniref:TraY domain-containing protein n=1 Tax=Pseudomonas aeruginosa group TaxID=136841 RepID=UPI00331593AA
MAAERLGRYRRRDAQQALVAHLQDFPDHSTPQIKSESSYMLRQKTRQDKAPGPSPSPRLRH